MTQDHDLVVIPPDWQEDLGIITSAYGPEEAGYLDDVVGHPPSIADDELPAEPAGGS